MWLTWLKGACAMTVGLGLVAFAASTEAGAAAWLFLFDLLKWPLDGDPAAFTAETFAMNAVLGGVMVGWGTLMYLLATGPIARGDRSLIGPLLAGLIAWFAVDSMGSLLAGLPGNVALNLGFVALFLPPLLGLRREPRSH